jgi:excisionase family DNA binding protein
VNANSDLLTPGEVANFLRVDPKTVTRWARQGRLTSIRTPGGHRRYKLAELNALRAGLFTDEDSPAGPQPAGLPSGDEIVLTSKDVDLIRRALKVSRMTGRLRLGNTFRAVRPGSVIIVVAE